MLQLQYQIVSEKQYRRTYPILEVNPGLRATHCSGKSNADYYNEISHTNTDAMLLPQLLERTLQLETESFHMINRAVSASSDDEKIESSKSKSKYNGLRCMRYNCTNKSELRCYTGFCSQACVDNVFEHTHSAGIILVGTTPTAHYTVVLRGRNETKISEHEWEAPGGVRERRLSETVIGCAIRECVEETGMVLKVDKLERHLLECPMVAMPTKIGSSFTGKYHLAIFVHINKFDHVTMHNAWSSRMNRYTQREIDKLGNPIVRSDSVDMEYSASMNLQHLWTISHNRVGKRPHPRKLCRILAEQLPTEIDPQTHISLCYRDYWCINEIYERSLMDLIMSIPTLEDQHIWNHGFLF
jgi:8-oxo-dGTP pyrophosphatase MutT (NUDIX family)